MVVVVVCVLLLSCVCVCGLVGCKIGSLYCIETTGKTLEIRGP